MELRLRAKANWSNRAPAQNAKTPLIESGAYDLPEQKGGASHGPLHGTRFRNSLTKAANHIEVEFDL
jgi:hypothetical protein